MAREYASPEIANLIVRSLPPEEFNRRVDAGLSDAEEQDLAELVVWFTRRYPTAKERLAYARRKLRQYQQAEAAPPVGSYLETAQRLANAHCKADPGTIHVMFDPDPKEKQIRLLEVTRSAPTRNDPSPVDFAPRPDLGIPYGLAILLLSVEEWDAVQAGQLELPAGWDVSRLQEL